MWPVDRVAHAARPTYLECISRVKNAELLARLASAVDKADAASHAYVAAAIEGKTHRLEPGDFDLPNVRVDEAVVNYDSRMAKMGSPGRPIYDEIMISSVRFRCPMCGHRKVSTLDHYLPKTLFAALAVDPANLVPCCAECNRVKGQFFADSLASELLHPYFDDVDSEPWLAARIERASLPATIIYYVSVPSSWDSLIAARVKAHFSYFNLAGLFGVQAADELHNIKHRLADLIPFGASEVRDHLAAEAASRRQSGNNTWQRALYEAISVDDWFCAGGFAQV
jgi:hypothetical protein